MATAFDNKQSKRTGLFLILIFLIIIFIISFLIGGIGGIFGVIRVFFIIAMVVGFFGFLFYIIYYLFFKKHPRNIPYENWKGYLKSALDNGSDMMDELILTGDKYHSSKRFMTIKGYLRIVGFDNKQYDMFVGKRSSISLIEDYKIVMLQADQHSDLIGDVYVYGISLIQKYGYYFLNQNMLDFKAIDKGVALDTFRTMTYETLGDMKGIVDRAIGFDSEYAKQRASEKLLKIPILSGQQQPPQQNQ